MAGAQGTLRLFVGSAGDGGLAAAERALALDPNLAEAHAAKARILTADGRHDEALREIEIALRLDPESYEVNRAAGDCYHSLRRFAEAIPYYEKAAAGMETDFPFGRHAGQLLQGDRRRGTLAAGRAAVARARREGPGAGPEQRIGDEHIVAALAALGEAERAKEWIERATLLDPDNLNMRYNFACTLVIELHEFEAALDLLAPVFENMRPDALTGRRIDPDLDPIRDHPRFKALLAAAEARLAQS